MVKTTIEVEEDLWRRFNILVIRERGGRKIREVINEMIQNYVERKGFSDNIRQMEHILQVEEEREAFLRIRDELLKDPGYLGKFVAILNGLLIGSDERIDRLTQSVYEKHGFIPIYIDKIIPIERHLEASSPESTIF